MNDSEKSRLIEVEERLKKTRHLLEGIMPIFISINTRRKVLEKQLNDLEDERTKLVQGQMLLNPFRQPEF